MNFCLSEGEIIKGIEPLITVLSTNDIAILLNIEVAGALSIELVGFMLSILDMGTVLLPKKRMYNKIIFFYNIKNT